MPATPSRPLALPSRVALTAAAALLALAACGGGDGADGTADADAPAAAAAAEGAPSGAGVADVPEVVELTERDVEQWLAAMDDLAGVGDRAQDRLGDDPGDARQMMTGLRANAEAMAVVRRHGFDAERFSRVHYSVMAAFMAAQMEEARPQQAEALRQLEEMKGKVPAEQYEAMKQAMQGAAAMTEAMGEQPESNVRLVRRYRERIERLGEGR